LKYGTHWDLEALFKVCNGEWDLQDAGKTANIGVLFPANARLLLGKENYFGFVQAVTYQDVMFTYNMVPIRTQVDLVFRRHVDIEATDVQAFLDRFPSSLVSAGSEEDNEDSGTSGDSDATIVGNNKDAPVPGYNTVTSGWYYKSGGFHGAWDYGLGGIGGRRVHATHPGKVTRAGWHWSYGNHVVIERGVVKMIYAHLRGFAPGLKEGDTIKVGDHLGFVGSTGSSTGNHLHYEERVNNQRRKPLYAINNGSVT
jgi:murein DD-endopeptidase MepM/ murein hydrolase activator NlpD